MVTTSVSSEIANTDRPLARRNGSRPLYGKSVDFLRAKNNRSKSVCTLFQRKHLNNQTVWPVIFGLTGPICARALKSQHMFKLDSRGHQDWPVKPVIRPQLRIRPTEMSGRHNVTLSECPQDSSLWTTFLEEVSLKSIDGNHS